MFPTHHRRKSISSPAVAVRITPSNPRVRDRPPFGLPLSAIRTNLFPPPRSASSTLDTMTVERAGDTGQSPDPQLHEIVLIDQVTSDSWCEGVAIRPNGNVLLAKLEEPELMALDLATAPPPADEFESIKPRLLNKFPEASGAFGLCALRGTEREEYAVSTAVSDPANGQFHTWTVWRVTMPPEDSDDGPEISEIATLPGGRFLASMIALSERTLATADANRGCVWRIDIPTGQVSVIIEDDTMGPAGIGYFGVNRVRFTEKFGWAANTSSGILYRFPVQWDDGGLDVKAIGPPEEIASGLDNSDGLTVVPDGSAAYICSYTSGHLWRVDMEGEVGAGKAEVIELRKDLVSPTGMELVYSDKREKPTLYIVCCGTIAEDTFDGERKYWLELAKLDKTSLQITVTVTTEVTYEYV